MEEHNICEPNRNEQEYSYQIKQSKIYYQDVDGSI